jgi:ABC-type sulfate transport system substrate-binding protein
LVQSKSIETTKRIISEIYDSVSILASDPEIYMLDTFKENNKGNIRISYLVEEEAVYILSVRYARKEPLEY